MNHLATESASAPIGHPAWVDRFVIVGGMIGFLNDPVITDYLFLIERSRGGSRCKIT